MFSQASVKISVHKVTWHPTWQTPHLADTPPGRHPTWQTPLSPEMATIAGGTHPTGMHSCSKFVEITSSFVFTGIKWQCNIKSIFSLFLIVGGYQSFLWGYCMIPLFCTSGDVCPEFQSQCGSHLGTTDSSNSPPVWHLLTSCQPACQPSLIFYPHICTSIRKHWWDSNLQWVCTPTIWAMLAQLKIRILGNPSNC